MPSRSGAPLLVAALALLADTSLACGEESDDRAEPAAPKSSEHEGTMTRLTPTTTACQSLLVGARAHVPVTVTRYSTINECVMPESGASLGCGGGPRRCVSSVNREGPPVQVPIHGIDHVDCNGSSAEDAGDVVDDDCDATFQGSDLSVSKASTGSAWIFLTVLHEGELVRASSALVITFSESPSCPVADWDAGSSPDATDGGADARQDASESDDASSADAASD